MNVILRNITSLNTDNPEHLKIMKAVNDAGVISYQNVPTGIVFSVERMPEDTELYKFEPMEMDSCFFPIQK
jgi:hypothetical protein